MGHGIFANKSLFKEAMAGATRIKQRPYIDVHQPARAVGARQTR
ncbi:MAG TPA: hypothetical protein VK453_09280 [Micromonosporaceae bacterium]|nr:hypothetical protein [Micromonosporaceae bacterium]